MFRESNNNPKITFDKVSFLYSEGNKQTLALNDLSFSINNNEFICILGPSGCGKTTILRLIAGFIRPTSGEVRVNNKLVVKPGADRGVVFQKYNLFPWRTVEENIEFGLRMGGIPKQERLKIVSRYLKVIGLTDFGKSYPNALSVGMQQRVGIVRAYANEPDILIMDEPFTSLDMQTVVEMRKFLLEIWDKNRKTIVFITHDIDEAIELADRIILLSSRPGKVKKEFFVDLPRPRLSEIYMNSDYNVLRNQITNLVLNSID